MITRPACKVPVAWWLESPVPVQGKTSDKPRLETHPLKSTPVPGRLETPIYEWHLQTAPLPKHFSQLDASLHTTSLLTPPPPSGQW